MKKIMYSLVVILLSASQIFAQTTTTKNYLIMAESRVKSGSVFAANQAKINPAIVKVSNGVIYSRTAHRGESGRTYVWTTTYQLGHFIDQSWDFYMTALKDFPGMREADSVNSNGPSYRSVWLMMNDLCQIPKDFKSSNYGFRRVTIFTVPFDKVNEFEDAQTKRSALAIKLGITTPFFVYKARFGYSTNTYMTSEPDESDIAYYAHRKERQEQKTNNNAEWQALSKITSPLTTNVRIDQIYIVK